MSINITDNFGDTTIFRLELSTNNLEITNITKGDRVIDNYFHFEELVPHLERLKEIAKAIENYKIENMFKVGSKVAIPTSPAIIRNSYINIKEVAKDIQQDYLIVVDSFINSNEERWVTLGLNKHASITTNTFDFKDIKPYEGGSK